MFSIQNPEALRSQFPTRTASVVNRDQIDHLPFSYCEFLSTRLGEEITPDINICAYEEALSANKYLQDEHPEIAERVWQIGDNGQGDEWFIAIDTGIVLFFDHEQGEYSMEGFSSLEIDFQQFLQLALLLRDLEEYLDQGVYDTKKLRTEFIAAVEMLHKGLFALIPYDYFQQ